MKVEGLNHSFIHCIAIMALGKFMAFYGLFISVGKNIDHDTLIYIYIYIFFFDMKTEISFIQNGNTFIFEHRNQTIKNING